MKKMCLDHDACTYCGLCVLFVPEVFRFGSHGKAEVYDPDGTHEKTIQTEAINICPVSCISWQEQTG